MIKAMLFDYGGVMTPGGRGGELVQRLEEVLQVDSQAATTVFESVWSRFTHGAIDEATLWRVIEGATGKTVPLSRRAIWNTWPHMKPDPAMVNLVAELRQKGFRVGLLSNTVSITSEAIRSNGGYDGFNPLILSCEVGLAKPELEIYEYAENQLTGVQPDEIVFVDDQPRCLEPAIRRGWKTVLAVTPDQIKTDLQKLIT